MTHAPLSSLTATVASLTAVREIGRVTAVEGMQIHARGLRGRAHVGDLVTLQRSDGSRLSGEILQLRGDDVSFLPDGSIDGVAIEDPVFLGGPPTIYPSPQWIGRILDASGQPLDGAPIGRGVHAVPLKAPPPPAHKRRPLGPRMETGVPVFNTMLPIVKGQRIGLFAGSGVGKSSLLGRLAKNMTADVVVIALVGERGRELRDFVEDVLGHEGLKRSVVIAATSDQSPIQRRRCLWAAMATAEYFRDLGNHVLFLADSVTRFAEAHREVAVAGGELPSLRGYPPSTAHLIMSLCERAGPGTAEQGDITAVLSVLVAGSDMDEPIADILRGVLDGHVVLDRHIAERGRFPAVDLLRSVSRSLPNAASHTENQTIREIRRLLGAYEQSETMVRAGLYSEGSDPYLDAAISAWPQLDAFLGDSTTLPTKTCFSKLDLILRRSGATNAAPAI
ncbi:FliI/YscN family ATPase [Shimia litoralis]|uniref:FliI/YscN family ATPase n=1 Tax=Shimia litoralis TaxID=420403 RepID=A0A4U7MT50_9RHOB|nr:FliI/YscN family ATPase [Shimia litoralis]TKZ15988.1 FliI/YscN family ATPase [Shimia litoralis]